MDAPLMFVALAAARQAGSLGGSEQQGQEQTTPPLARHAKKCLTLARGYDKGSGID
jgi:hypothetical protein